MAAPPPLPSPSLPVTESPLTSPTLKNDHYALNETIPPSHKWRTIVLCFDGTGDQFDSDNSNIVQLFSMLKKDNRHEQLVYYQAGIGTYTVPQVATPFWSKISKTLDMMLGVHLDAHVMSGYEFLMQNYQEGDKICIFGFSRGSYTARALAGMLHKIGLLPVSNHQQVPFAYHMFTKEDDVGWAQSKAFKKAFSIDVQIEFLGVFDTVASVGLVEKRLPFTKSNTHIKFFRHAIALDEHRAKFRPNFWQRTTEADSKLGVQPGEMPRSDRKWKARKSLMDLENEYTTPGWSTVSDVEEVWFTGCHCDVGGGSVTNGTRNALARIPLRWMIRQCFIANTGILFHREMFKDIGMDPDGLYPVVKPRPPPIEIKVSDETHLRTMSDLSKIATAVNHDSIGPANVTDFVSEEHEELADALCPMYDQLKLKLFWWILEFLPQVIHYQTRDDVWRHELSLNLARGRHIPGQHHFPVKIHRSVKIRKDAGELLGQHYTPKAKLEVDPVWVD